jgi:hypothetical protein
MLRRLGVFVVFVVVAWVVRFVLRDVSRLW